MPKGLLTFRVGKLTRWPLPDYYWIFCYRSPEELEEKLKVYPDMELGPELP